MKKIGLKVGGRVFSLAYTLDAMCEMSDTIPDFDMDKFSEYAKNPGRLLDLLVALARQGEAMEGRALDVDRAWFGRHISPAPVSVAKVQVAVYNALAAGMTMETDDGSDGEVDVVLADIKKKDGMDASPGGGSSTTA